MKTINFLAITLAVFIFTISFASSSFGNDKKADCINCDTQCIENGCCKANSGSAQGNSNCCSDKCTSETCKECCAGSSSLMNSSDSDKISDNNKNFTDNETKSCCFENNVSGNKTKHFSK